MRVSAVGNGRHVPGMRATPRTLFLFSPSDHQPCCAPSAEGSELPTRPPPPDHLPPGSATLAIHSVSVLRHAAPRRRPGGCSGNSKETWRVLPRPELSPGQPPQCDSGQWGPPSSAMPAVLPPPRSRDNPRTTLAKSSMCVRFSNGGEDERCAARCHPLGCLPIRGPIPATFHVAAGARACPRRASSMRRVGSCPWTRRPPLDTVPLPSPQRPPFPPLSPDASCIHALLPATAAMKNHRAWYRTTYGVHSQHGGFPGGTRAHAANDRLDADPPLPLPRQAPPSAMVCVGVNACVCG